MIIISLFILYGMFDMYPAEATDARFKTIYTVESAGPRTLSGVKAEATLRLPDSAGSGTLAYNTVSGEAYSTNTPTDSSRTSGTDGRVAIRLPLTSDIYPPGCSWQIAYEYRKMPRRTVLVTLTDTTQQCLAKVLGLVNSCP